MKAVIMAGGKGTRLSSLTNDLIPKPMVQLNEKPILEYQIEVLKKNGIYDFVFLVGHLHQAIEDYFGDGSRFGITIEYVIESFPMGSAGALCFLKDKIQDTFLLVFGDIIFDISIARFLTFHEEHKAKISLFVHPNSHPYDSDLVILDDRNKVISFDSKTNKRDYYYPNLVNAGLYMMDRSILDQITGESKWDLDKDIIHPMIRNDENVFGYISPEYVKDVGTPERLFDTENDIANKIVEQKSLLHKQKCIFLDRDGTVNKYVGLLTKPEELVLEQGVCDAINHLHRHGYLVIIITNQPVVARNLCTMEEVRYIHNKMETDMGIFGTYVDAISFCPHHPDKGYPEENKQFKIVCNCRKPKTGMIDRWIFDYHISKEDSWMIGDTTIDVQTGRNAALRTILVKTGLGGSDNKFDVVPEYECNNLIEAVEYITKERRMEK